MKKSVQLKQTRASKIKEQGLLLEARTANENAAFTAEQETSFRTLNTEIEGLDQEIRDAEAVELAEQRVAELSGAPVGGSEQREHEGLKKRYSFHKAIRSQMPNGVLDGVEKEVHEETVLRAKEAGVMISGLAVPMMDKRATGATVTEDSGAYGGNLVATELQAPIEFLRPKPILETLGARFMSGLTGNLKFPTNDGGVTGAWEGEVDTAANTKTAYGSKEMKPNRYAAAALISLQNLMQSNGDLEMFTINDIKAAIANAIDLAGINGAGSSGVPLGILNASGTNAVVGGTNGATPTWGHIVGMETGIFSANGDAEGMAYLINPATKGKLKTTAHASNNGGYLMSTDNTINGYKVGVSNHVPGDLTKGTLSGKANAGIFGDFKQMLIGQWGFLDITVDNTSKKKDGYVEIIVNTFIDVLVRQPKAFSVIKDWKLS